MVQKIEWLADELPEDGSLIKRFGAQEGKKSAQVLKAILDRRASQTAPHLGFQKQVRPVEIVGVVADSVCLIENDPIPADTFQNRFPAAILLGERMVGRDHYFKISVIRRIFLSDAVVLGNPESLASVTLYPS